MTASENSAIRLRVALRRYAPLLVVLVAAVTLTALISTPGAITDEPPSYEATALVVATELTMRPEGLPRFASAVFEGGSVAEAAVADAGLTTDPADLVGDHAELRPYENTVVMEVVGIDVDPSTAAATANAMASALVTELNRAGPGVGVFAIQDTARVPGAPLEAGGAIGPTFIGFTTGVVLALGVLGLLLALRRPVLTPYDAATAAGVPALATLTLPGRSAPGDVPAGAAALARQVLPAGPGRCGLVSSERAAGARRRVVVALSQVHAGARPVTVVTDADAQEWPALAGSGVDLAPKLPATCDGRLTIVDDPDARTLVELSAAAAPLVLVVAAGEAASSVQSAVGQLLPGDLVGVVLVQRSSDRLAGLGPALRRLRQALAPGAEREPEPAPSDAVAHRSGP